MSFIKLAASKGLLQVDKQFSSYHESVFGSMGSFNYEADGATLKVLDGGVLLGGWYYQLDNEESFTIKDATTYLCVELDKAELGEPRFRLATTWQRDSSTHYVATVLLIKLARGEIIQVDKIGGNLPEVYNLLSQDVEELKANTLDTVERAMESRTRYLLGEIEGVAKKLSGYIDENMKTVNTKLQTLDTRLKANETKTGDMDTTINAMDTKLRGVDTRLNSMNTKVQGIDTRLGTTATKVRLLDTRLSTTDTNLQRIALYKHSIRIQFFVSGGLSGMIDARYVVNVLFNIYSKKTTPFIVDPNSPNTPSLIEQIRHAMYDDKPIYSAKENVVSATGDCIIWANPDIHMAHIWGIACYKPEELVLFYSEHRAHNQKQAISSTKKKGLYVSKTFYTEETITRVL